MKNDEVFTEISKRVDKIEEILGSPKSPSVVSDHIRQLSLEIHNLCEVAKCKR